jgi:hypothetical protein
VVVSFSVAARARDLYNQWFVQQGRSSVVEQRPFKPKVVGPIPTAPTNLTQIKGLTIAQVVKKSESRQLSHADVAGNGVRVHVAESTPSQEFTL